MFILKRLFGGIKMDDSLQETFNDLPQDATVILVSKYKSHFEFLFYYIRYMQAKLPFPQLGFDYRIKLFQPVVRLLRIVLHQFFFLFRHFSFQDPYRTGFIRSEIEKGTTGFLPLLEKRDFYRRFIKSKTDPIYHLIEIQQTLDRPVCIVPQLMFFSNSPSSTRPTLMDSFLGPPHKPGGIRRLITLFHKPETIFFEVSDITNLKQFLDLPENRGRSNAHLAAKLRQDLLIQINAHRKSITGPMVKTPEEIKQEILTGEDLRRFMATYAKRRDTTIYRTHREAMGYVDEIAANYSPAFVTILHRLMGRPLQIMFESVTFNTEALATIKRVSRQGPIVFVPAHKSHMDSLLLSYTLYDNHMPCPHVFAGKNLAFWPMAPFFRRMGAFFVRRSFKGAVFYAKVFSAYIFQVLREGFNIAVYIEGTRSRSGKLLQPQLGMLSILLNAFFDGACKNLIFVPVFIAYDRVPDEGSYLHEISGGKKKPESFRQMLKAKRMFNNRYGKVHLNFGQPLAINDLLAEQRLAGVKLTSKQQNALCREIGARMMSAIDRQAMVTPQSLVATALLSGGKEIVSHDELMLRIRASMDHFCSQGTCISGAMAEDYPSSVTAALHYYKSRKFIQFVDSQVKGGSYHFVLRVVENRRNALDYYKNISICHLIPTALTAMAILEKDAFQFSATDLHEGYRRIQHLFSEEFNTDPLHPPAYIVRKVVKAFIDDALLVPHPAMPDTYNLPAEGFRKLLFFCGIIEPYLESYVTTLTYFAKNRRNHHSRSKMLKKILAIGNRMFRQGEIRLKESISKANYDNAVNFFNKNGVRGSEDEEAIRRWDRLLAHYRNLISR